MNQNLRFTLNSISCSSALKMFIFILLLLQTRKTSCATDPMYLACKEPKTCDNGTNNINITFPFYIQGQNPSCGQPGFEVTCNTKGNPILTLSENNYTVKEIFYDNQTIHLSNDGWFGPKSTSCVRPIRNMSLPNDRFAFVGNVGKLLLFYNCSMTLQTERLSNYYSETDDCSSVLAVSEDNSDMGNVTKYCNNRVAAPVNMYGDKSDYNISAVFIRGFGLKWSASDCSACLQTGGRCGFDNTTSRFQCFCPHRAHARHCPAPVVKVRYYITNSPLIATDKHEKTGMKPVVKFAIGK
ncbi:hypothetical protein ACFE04_017663 [Oxalis oulophora]